MTREVFYFEDLSDSAKEKAREWYRKCNDFLFLEDDLREYTREALEEKGFDGYGAEDLEPVYSLSYSQGDGYAFSGKVKHKKTGKRYKVIADRRYPYIADVVEVDDEGNETEAPKVKAIMEAIAEEIKRRGYDEIEWQNSAEYIDEAINANGYTFTSDGKRLDADNIA